MEQRPTSRADVALDITLNRIHVFMQFDICPKCKGKFVVAANRAHPAVLGELVLGAPKSSTQLLTESALVKCPHCSHTYASDNVRFFGVLTRRQLSGVLLFFVTSFAAVAIYLAVTAQ